MVLESGVLVVFDGIVSTARKKVGDGSPLITVPGMDDNDDGILN